MHGKPLLTQSIYGSWHADGSLCLMRTICTHGHVEQQAVECALDLPESFPFGCVYMLHGKATLDESGF